MFTNSNSTTPTDKSTDKSVIHQVINVHHCFGDEVDKEHILFAKCKKTIVLNLVIMFLFLLFLFFCVNCNMLCFCDSVVAYVVDKNLSMQVFVFCSKHCNDIFSGRFDWKIFLKENCDDTLNEKYIQWYFGCFSREIYLQ